MRPQSPEEVVDAVRGLRSSGTAALIVGGGTLLDVGDPTRATVRLEMRGLAGVMAYEPADLTITCRAGTTVAELEEALGGSGQTLGIGHPFPEDATIGGLVAFGHRGPGAVLRGRLRDAVLEVRAVTGEGKLVRGGGKVVKNVTGFDLPRLFFGSMGTLGVIVELTLKVRPLPGPLVGVRIAARDPDRIARRLREAVVEASMPVEGVAARGPDGWEGLAFAPGPPEDAERLLGPLDGASLSDPDGTFSALASSPLVAPRSGEVVVRASVPPARMPALVERIAGAERAVCDVAGGTGWAEVDPSAVPDLRAACEEVGGSLVLLRAPDPLRQAIGTWGRPARGVEIMRRLKELFDPDDVLGPRRFVV